MDLSSSIFEAFKNSAESGAENIKIDVVIENGIAMVTVLDDGKNEIAGDVFKDGFSTKGEGRGRGLYLVRKDAISTGLERKNGKTEFTLCKYDDETLKTVEDTLFPIFQYDRNTEFSLIDGNRKVSVSSDEVRKLGLIPNTPTQIKKFKAWVREHRS